MYINKALICNAIFILIFSKYRSKAFPNAFDVIFSSAWLCQQNSWNLKLSVVCRPSFVSHLSQNLLSRFVSNFSCGFPCAIPQTFFDFKKNPFTNFFKICFVVVHMGPYWSQNFKMLLLPQVTFESFQTFFLNFLLWVVLTKVLFANFSWIFF